MATYLNKSGRSGVESFDEDDGGITVTFKGGGTYRYPIESNGHYLISQMTSMARNGEFLNRLINSAQPKYEGGEGGILGHGHLLKEADEKEMSRIHSKFVWRNPSVKAAVKEALEKKMRQTPSYATFKQLRGLR